MLRVLDSFNLGGLIIQISVEVLLEIENIPVDTVNQLLEPYFNVFPNNKIQLDSLQLSQKILKSWKKYETMSSSFSWQI
jgi:hypothetical protein